MDPTPKPPVVINLGKRSRKRIRRLRRGEGPLMRDVRETLADLRANGRISNDAEAVVFVVQRKGRRGGVSSGVSGSRLQLPFPVPKCF